MNSDLVELDVFISHASEDNDTVARPLCRLLRSHGLSVWLDENELELGDSLDREIDEAIANCHYGIVILSQAFLQKSWTSRELKALIAREGTTRKIVLPVWHGITQEIIEHSYPALAERKYVTTDRGIEAVADSVLRVLQQDAARNVRQSTGVIEELAGQWDLSKAEPLILRLLRNSCTTDSPAAAKSAEFLLSFGAASGGLCASKRA